MLKTTDTLYYDGNCPLCMGEMRLLSRLKNEALVLINIHQLPVDSPAAELEKNKLLSCITHTDAKRHLA